jgi:two-component system response regulator ChvI
MPSRGTRTVAIVNDEQSLIELLRFNLERRSYLVRAYTNTSDALDLIQDPADVALIDRTNWPFDGLELYSRLRRSTAMPVVFLSTWAGTVPKELDRLGLPPAQGYIQCPFALADVFETVRKVLDEARA